MKNVVRFSLYTPEQRCGIVKQPGQYSNRVLPIPMPEVVREGRENHGTHRTLQSGWLDLPLGIDPSREMGIVFSKLTGKMRGSEKLQP